MIKHLGYDIPHKQKFGQTLSQLLAEKYPGRCCLYGVSFGIQGQKGVVEAYKPGLQ